MKSWCLFLGLAAATVVGCRGDEDGDGAFDGGTGTTDVGPGRDVGPGQDVPVVVGDCPMGQGSSFTVCELKNPNPRQPEIGDVVEVQGVVVTTAPFSLTMELGSGLDGFFVQDQETTATLEGRYSGVVVTYRADEVSDLPSTGDVIQVTGRLQEFGRDGADQQTQIELTRFDRAGTAAPTPQTVSPARIASGPDARAYEGVLVEVRDVEATQVRDIPGAGGSSIFGAFLVTGDLVVRNGLHMFSQPAQGARFARITGILRVGTAPFDAGIYGLFPRTALDLEAGGGGGDTLTSVVALQDPSTPGRPSICTQTGGLQTRMGTCPPVRFEGVRLTAVGAPGAGNRRNLYVQDPSAMDGRFAGVRVFSANIEGGDPSVGSTGTLTGVAVLFNGGLQVADATFTVTGPGEAIPPVVVTPQDIPGTVTLTGGEVTNPYEGVLVRVENVDVTERCIDSNGDRGLFGVTGGVIIGVAFPYAYNGRSRMGVMHTCASMDREDDQRTVGDRFRAITGVMDYAFDTFRLTPRGDADLDREMN